MQRTIKALSITLTSIAMLYGSNVLAVHDGTQHPLVGVDLNIPIENIPCNLLLSGLRFIHQDGKISVNLVEALEWTDSESHDKPLLNLLLEYPDRMKHLISNWPAILLMDWSFNKNYPISVAHYVAYHLDRFSFEGDQLKLEGPLRKTNSRQNSFLPFSIVGEKESFAALAIELSNIANTVGSNGLVKSSPEIKIEIVLPRPMPAAAKGAFERYQERIDNFVRKTKNKSKMWFTGSNYNVEFYIPDARPIFESDRGLNFNINELIDIYSEFVGELKKYSVRSAVSTTPVPAAPVENKENAFRRFFRALWALGEMPGGR